MTFFDRQIRYLDYLEHGNKIRNGGFVKAEVRDGECRVQVSIKGLYPTDTLQGELFLHSKGKEYKADTLLLRFGTGAYTVKWNADNLAGCGVAYADWDGVHIRLSEQRVLQAIWREREAEESDGAESPVLPEDMAAEICAEEHPQTESETEKVTAEKATAEKVTTEKSAEKVFAPEAERTARFQSLYEDKWTQLGQFYKTIYPFGDQRGYLSITPGDFIVLPEKFQKLVSNSFLLHGYYNYGHVLLGKQEEREGNAYFLGVPGIYHEREKQVARMFGFEGFEGASAPYAEGSFGYYMISVEL